MAAQFAYAQWPWGTKTREEFIQSCKDLSEVGFRYFESVKPFIDTFKNDIDDFKAIVREYDVKPVSFYFHLNGTVENDIEDLKKKIPFLEKNDIHRISVQAETIRGRNATPEELDYALRTITEIGRICKAHGVVPCVHPHYNTTIMIEKEIDFIMTRTDPDLVAFGPDTAHLSAGGCNPWVILDRYKERIKFIHLKDLKGALSDGGMEQGIEVYTNFRELGEGDIDFKPIFAVLKGIPYDGYLCAELDKTRFTHKESARMNMEYLKTHW